MTEHPKVIAIAPFPGCCGSIVMFGFGHSPSASRNHNIPIDEVMKQVKKNLLPAYGLIQVILNSDQKPLYHKHLLAAGFQPVVEDFFWKGHGRDLFQYVWGLEASEAERARATAFAKAAAQVPTSSRFGRGW